MGLLLGNGDDIAESMTSNISHTSSGFVVVILKNGELTCSPGGPGSPGFPVGGGGGGVGGRVGTPVRGIFNPGRHPTRSPVKLP